MKTAPIFSHDGKTVLWSVVYSGLPPLLLEMRYENGAWSAPARPLFASSTSADIYPSFSVDGKQLFFSSKRPLPPGYPPLRDWGIWVVEKRNTGWGEPSPLDTTVSSGREYAHSISRNETIYFSSRRHEEGYFDIFSSRKEDGKYLTPEALANGINTEGYEDGPYILTRWEDGTMVRSV